jgi:peptidylprolyl isomerase
LYAKIRTNKSIVQLDFEKAPITVANYVALAGRKITWTNDLKKANPFDGLKFHSGFQIYDSDWDPLGTGSVATLGMFKRRFSDLKFDKGGVWLWPITDRQPTAANFYYTLQRHG